VHAVVWYTEQMYGTVKCMACRTVVWYTERLIDTLYGCLVCATNDRVGQRLFGMPGICSVRQPVVRCAKLPRAGGHIHIKTMMILTWSRYNFEKIQKVNNFGWRI